MAAVLSYPFHYGPGGIDQNGNGKGLCRISRENAENSFQGTLHGRGNPGEIFPFLKGWNE